MSERIKGYLIHTESNTVREMEFSNELNSLLSLINCDCITMPRISISGQIYTVVCADKPASDAKTSAITEDYKRVLRGNLLIVEQGELGRIKSLTDEDIKTIENNIGLIHVKHGNTSYNSYALYHCKKVEDDRELIEGVI